MRGMEFLGLCNCFFDVAFEREFLVNVNSQELDVLCVLDSGVLDGDGGVECFLVGGGGEEVDKFGFVWCVFESEWCGSFFNDLFLCWICLVAVWYLVAP